MTVARAKPGEQGQLFNPRYLAARPRDWHERAAKPVRSWRVVGVKMTMDGRWQIEVDKREGPRATGIDEDPARAVVRAAAALEVMEPITAKTAVAGIKRYLESVLTRLDDRGRPSKQAPVSGPEAMDGWPDSASARSGAC